MERIYEVKLIHGVKAGQPYVDIGLCLTKQMLDTGVIKVNFEDKITSFKIMKDRYLFFGKLGVEKDGEYVILNSWYRKFGMALKPAEMRFLANKPDFVAYVYIATEEEKIYFVGKKVFQNKTLYTWYCKFDYINQMKDFETIAVKKVIDKNC